MTTFEAYWMTIIMPAAFAGLCKWLGKQKPIADGKYADL